MLVNDLVVKLCVIQKLPSNHQGLKHLEARGRFRWDVPDEYVWEFEEVPGPANQPLDPFLYPLNTCKQCRDYVDGDEFDNPEFDDPEPAPADAELDSPKILWIEFVFPKGRPYKIGTWQQRCEDEERKDLQAMAWQRGGAETIQ